MFPERHVKPVKGTPFEQTTRADSNASSLNPDTVQPVAVVGVASVWK